MVFTYSTSDEIENIQTVPEFVNQHETSSSQNEQIAPIVNEAISQKIGKAHVQEVTEDLMTEEVEQDDHMRNNKGQLSLSEDDGEQVGEIDNLIENVEYEQARII